MRDGRTLLFRIVDILLKHVNHFTIIKVFSSKSLQLLLLDDVEFFALVDAETQFPLEFRFRFAKIFDVFGYLVKVFLKTRLLQVGHLRADHADLLENALNYPHEVSLAQGLIKLAVVHHVDQVHSFTFDFFHLAAKSVSLEFVPEKFELVCHDICS